MASTLSETVKRVCTAPVNRIPHTESKRYREIRSEIGVVFPMSLRAKMTLTIGTLLVSMLAAPVTYVRRDSIRAIEGTGSLPETLSLFAGLLILIGNLNTFFVGVYMLKYVRERTTESSLDRDEIARKLRLEDFVMWFQVWGTLAVFAPLALLVAAAVIPGGPELMYDAGITIYRPFETVPLDMRLVSGVSGGLCGVVLAALWWFVRR
jgi:hypothetical protein